MTLFSRADGAIKSFIIRLLFLNGQSLRRWRGKVESTIVRRAAQVKLLEWARGCCSSTFIYEQHTLFLLRLPMNILSLIFILANNIINLSIFLSIISCVFGNRRSLPLLFSRFMNGHYAHFLSGCNAFVFAAAVKINQYQPALKHFEINRKSSASGPRSLDREAKYS